MPEPGEGGTTWYRAIAGKRQCVGKTAGEALDAISAQLPAEKEAPWSSCRTFSQTRFSRKSSVRVSKSLWSRWRTARGAGAALPPVEQAELDNLVQEEIAAAGQRARALRHELET